MHAAEIVLAALVMAGGRRRGTLAARPVREPAGNE